QAEDGIRAYKVTGVQTCALPISGETATEAGSRGILSTHLHSDGRQHDILYVDGGPSSTGTAGFLRMEGREVFRQAIQHLAEAIRSEERRVGKECRVRCGRRG